MIPPNRKSIVAYVVTLVVIAGLFKTAFPCSPSPTRPQRSITQLAILAPVVVVGKVLNISVPASVQRFTRYSACFDVLEVIKGNRSRIPQRFCTEYFGSDSLCLTHVYPSYSYVFYLNEDLKARYDTEFSAAIYATASTIILARMGYCNSSEASNSTCVPPILTDPPNQIISAKEGETLQQLTCHALGSKPSVVTWYFGGKRHGLPSKAIVTYDGTLILKKITSSYQGRYTCVVQNAAGTTSQDIHFFVESKPCGENMMVNERSHIYTPNFPGPYPADKWCAWRFCPPTNKRLKFIFNVFDLARYDSIMIENECDMAREPWRTYCGTSSPGEFVSHCKSNCVQLRLRSQLKFEFEMNIFFGMNVTVEPTTESSTPKVDVFKLYCNSDFAFKGRFVNWLGNDITIYAQESFKEPFQNQTTYTLENSNINGYGCYQRFRSGKDYYFLGTIKNRRFIVKTKVPDDHKEASIFQKKLTIYKNMDSPCRPEI